MKILIKNKIYFEGEEDDDYDEAILFCIELNNEKTNCLDLRKNEKFILMN